MENISFHTFPATEVDALAMLYIQNQNLTGVSPEALFDMYRDTCKKIRDHRRETVKANHKIRSPILY